MKNFKKNRQKRLDKPAQMQLNVNPNDLPSILCECGCDLFVPCVKIKRVSAIISPDGQEKLLSFQTSACVKCHAALPDKP